MLDTIMRRTERETRQVCDLRIRLQDLLLRHHRDALVVTPVNRLKSHEMFPCTVKSAPVKRLPPSGLPHRIHCLRLTAPSAPQTRSSA
jgi:hypothetical protein